MGLLIAVGAMWLLAGPINAASADCPGEFAHVQGKADSDANNDNVQGFRNSIHTGDFVSQCHTVRSTTAFKDAANYVEVGWFQGSLTSNQTPKVFVTEFFNNQPTDVVYGGRTPGPGSDHEYKISNGGGDFDWHVEYNGDGLDNYIATFRSASFDATNSERRHATDNLFDHHDNIQICTGSSGDCDGRWHNPAAYHVWNDNAGNYDFCRNSLTESHVQGNC
jgi:hypothetical protein